MSQSLIACAQAQWSAANIQRMVCVLRKCPGGEMCPLPGTWASCAAPHTELHGWA